MLRELMTAAALLALLAGSASADPNGGVADTPPGQTQNPNDDRSGPGASGPGSPPGNLFETPTFAPAEQHLVVAHHSPSDAHGSDAPSGGGGPGQKGQPGPDGNAGP